MYILYALKMENKTKKWIDFRVCVYVMQSVFYCFRVSRYFFHCIATCNESMHWIKSCVQIYREGAVNIVVTLIASTFFFSRWYCLSFAFDFFLFPFRCIIFPLCLHYSVAIFSHPDRPTVRPFRLFYANSFYEWSKRGLLKQQKSLFAYLFIKQWKWTVVEEY